jgi:hypothetical protein
LGAKEALVGSHLGHGSGDILLDELNCKGTESSLEECKFDPWTKHDCRSSEWAGAICKIEEEDCKDEVIVDPHHAEGRVDPKVREHQNGFRFWIPQSM